jgi:CheY-like chemotaxis protein
MNAALPLPGPHGRPIELLLIDDSYADALLMKQAFGKSRVANKLSVAEDGEQALLMLRREAPFGEQLRPDLILLDLNLPRLSGREVLKAIKLDNTLNSIPVIIFSGSRTEAEIVGSYSLHANAYIAKPMNFKDLEEIVWAIEFFWFAIAAVPDGAQSAN